MTLGPRFSNPMPDENDPSIDRPLQVSEGERKVVTVLFADIVGSLGQGRGFDDEDFREFLDGALAQMAAAVAEYGGTVARVQGDGIMALFGAPVAREDHAVRACLSALQMRDAFAGEIESAGLRFRAQVRIGLHTGEAIVRSIESQHSRDYDAVGKAVHLAGRMEQLCTPGSILATADVMAHAHGLFDTVPVTLGVKGLDEELELYTVVGERRATGAEAESQAPLVGRQPILADFDDLLAGLKQGGSAVYRIEGEAGLGKTRLLQAFAERAAAAGLEPVIVRGASHLASVPYATVKTLIATLLQTSEQALAGGASEPLVARFDLIGFDDPMHRVAIASLLGSGVQDGEWISLTPAERRVRLLSAVAALWRCIAAGRPSLLVLEDLHWMHATCLETYEQIVAADAGAPLLVVASSRPTTIALPAHLAAASVARLEPLSTLETRQLIELVSTDSPMSEADTESIMSRSVGIPFYVRELVSDHHARLVAPERAMERPIQVGSDGSANGIPLAIEASILARLDNLPETAKRIAQTVSVVGLGCEDVILQSACGLSAPTLEAEAVSLTQANLLERVGGQLAFLHEITRDVCARSIVRPRRRSLHRNVFRAMQEVWANSTGDASRVHALAYHAEQAELWDEAFANLTRACGLAIKNSAVEEAARLYLRADSAMSKIRDSDTRIAKIDLRLLVFPAFLTLGALDRMSQALEEAADLAAEINDYRRLAIATSQLGTAQWLSGDHEAAIVSSKSALALTDKEEHLPLWLHAEFTLANAHHGRGDLLTAIEGHRRIVETLERLGLESEKLRWAGIPSVMSRAFLCWFLIEKGDFAEARRQLDRGRAIADPLAQPYAQVLLDLGEGLYHLRQGYGERAIPILEEGLRLCQEYAVNAQEAINAAWLASALVMTGRPDDALSIALDSYKRNTHWRGGKYNWFYLFNAIGEAEAARGNLEEGLAWVERAIRVTEEAGEPIHNAQGLKTRGDIQLRPGRPERAVEDLRAARELAERHHLAPLAADCDLSLARAHALLGQRAQAVAHQRRALAGFEALGLERLAERARQAAA